MNASIYNVRANCIVCLNIAPSQPRDPAWAKNTNSGENPCKSSRPKKVQALSKNMSFGWALPKSLTRLCNIVEIHSPNPECHSSLLCQHNNNDYLVIVDVLSNYPDIYQIPTQSSTAVIKTMQYGFSQFGVMQKNIF